MMPQGIQVWDASGNLIFDTNDQTVKIFGITAVGATTSSDTDTGTITDARFTMFAGHDPFYITLEGGQGTTDFKSAPVWSFSGNNLNWSYPIPGNRPREKILYGVAGRVI